MNVSGEQNEIEPRYGINKKMNREKHFNHFQQGGGPRERYTVRA